jgi:hypothetical protein
MWVPIALFSSPYRRVEAWLCSVCGMSSKEPIVDRGTCSSDGSAVVGARLVALQSKGSPKSPLELDAAQSMVMSAESPPAPPRSRHYHLLQPHSSSSRCKGMRSRFSKHLLRCMHECQTMLSSNLVIALHNKASDNQPPHGLCTMQQFGTSKVRQKRF